MSARPSICAARPRAGFTIVEIVLAMGILVMGATAVLGMLTFGAALTRTAELRSAAAAAVEAVNADIDRNLFPYADGQVGEPVELSARRVAGVEGLIYTARATQNPERPREYRVDVELSWESSGVRCARSYSILRLREISFGERLRRELVEGEERPSGAPGGTRGPANPR